MNQWRHAAAGTSAARTSFRPGVRLPAASSANTGSPVDVGLVQIGDALRRRAPDSVSSCMEFSRHTNEWLSPKIVLQWPHCSTMSLFSSPLHRR